MPKKNAHRPRNLQAEAIALMIAGHGPTEVSEKLGISRQRFWAWRKDPVFAKQLEDAELTLSSAVVDDAVEQARMMLRAAAPSAIETLVRALTLKDDLAIKGADLLLKRVTELMPIERHELTIGTLEERIAEAGEAASD